MIKLFRICHHRDERDSKLELLEVGHVSLVLRSDQLRFHVVNNALALYDLVEERIDRINERLARAENLSQ